MHASFWLDLELDRAVVNTPQNLPRAQYDVPACSHRRTNHLAQVEVELGGLDDEADTAVTERRAAVPWLTADGVGEDPYGVESILAPCYRRLVGAGLLSCIAYVRVPCSTVSKAHTDEYLEDSDARCTHRHGWKSMIYRNRSLHTDGMWS